MFACDEASITPDIMCIGKALTGGVMTLAATCAKNDIFNEFLGDDLSSALMSGPTYMANPVACAAANASLDLFETEDAFAKVAAIEKQLYDELLPCKKIKTVKDVRVKGAIGVVQIDTDWKEILSMRQQFITHGVWLRPFNDVIYIMPPFTISQKELSSLTDAVKKILQLT